ncbi:down syndrome cell adhesion molecule-like protein 1 [Caerostris darwini]|uniref:Down syndrome cell adhesion molecule-like protein 1 n=1 Tax=Caerostris darwini TaxID=1538125 RepID=A0AAV4WI28_9ARAC|nr:down syndrome cell adhesion molecule-like protein 1 [Caerostris darwini]
MAILKENKSNKDNEMFSQTDIPICRVDIFEVFCHVTNGRELPFNERQQVNMNGSFFLKDVTRETDEGTYTCTAVNKQKERAQKDLHIRVMKKPRINPFAFPKLLAEGNHVIVTCSVLTGDPPITIRWLKDGMTLNKKMLNIDESSMGHLGSALVFNSVGRSHNGNYTCLAENAAGESNFTATMLVNGKLL